MERVVAYRPKSSATLSPAQEALQESLPPTARAKEDDPMAAEDGPGGQYLCKWRDLPYKEATWETWENVYSHTPEPEALKKSVNAFLYVAWPNAVAFFIDVYATADNAAVTRSQHRHPESRNDPSAWAFTKPCQTT